MSYLPVLARVREAQEDLCGQLALLAREVAATHGGMEEAFIQEREAERDLLLNVLEAVRPAFPWLSEHEGPVNPVSGTARTLYRQVVIDTRTNRKKPDLSYDWVAFDHPELGLAVARKVRACVAELVWPGDDLPSGRTGGPRLDEALERLVDRLGAHVEGNAARRRREANEMAERLRAVQVLLRCSK